MPNKININTYQNAYDIIYGQWLNIDPCDHYETENSECIIESQNPSPDDQIIRAENFKELSDEAKEIVNAILYSPAEMLDLIQTPKTKKITLRGIKKYFTQKWKSQFITDLTIKEIQTWVSKL